MSAKIRQIGIISVRFSTNESSLRKVRSELDLLPKRLQNKIIRKALRSLGSSITADVKTGISWEDPEVRRNIKVKIKSYKRGKLIWMGVGALRGANDYVLLRARWYNDGWKPYPKGVPTGRKGKGWRRGLRNAGGTTIYKTEYINNAYRRALPVAAQKVYASILEGIAEIRKV
jgi:hypothetical protein